MTIVYIFITLIILKICKIPGFKEIQWKWFILGPIIFFIAKALYKVLFFVFSVAMFFFVMDFVVWIALNFFCNEDYSLVTYKYLISPFFNWCGELISKIFI